MNDLPKFERELMKDLLSFIDDPYFNIVMLWGPRRSGKTTLILQAQKYLSGTSQYINMDDYQPRRALQEFPELFGDEHNSMGTWMTCHWMKARKRAAQSAKTSYLIIDEIQKLDNWSQIVKGLWDEDRRNFHALQIVLLGSSPHLLQKGLTESLAGRFIKFHSPHWSFSEMSEAFGYTLEEFIFFGGYPGGARYRHNFSKWKEHISGSIVQTNIDKDIISLISITHPGAMKRLYEIGTKQSGQPMSLKKISDSLQGGSQALLQHYLDILEQVFMLAGLRHFSQSTYKQFGVPKFQVLNTALMSAAFDYTFSEATNTQQLHWGRVVESAVGAHIMSTARQGSKLYYWRYNGYEVDFVVETSSHLLLLEVKSGKRKSLTKGAQAFTKLHRNNMREIKFYSIGTDGDVSIEDFLGAPASHWLAQWQGRELLC